MSGVRVDVATRSAHHRKYGTTFAESWTNHDGTTIAAVGAVISGADRIAVSDLLRIAVRALAGSRVMFENAVVGLDRIVQKHAAEHRDDELAASVALLCVPPGEDRLAFVGAGQLHVALFDLVGTPGDRMHGRFAMLGTGLTHVAGGTVSEQHRFHHDEVLVASTEPVPTDWWRGDRSAAAALAHAADAEASAAVIVPN